MLGDVGQPDLVEFVGVEDPTDVIVVDRRTGRLAGSTTLAQDGRGDLLQRTQPLYPVLRGLVPGYVQLVGDEPVAELGIVGMDVDDGVGQVRVIPVPVRDRVGAPLVEPWVEKPSTRQVTVTGIPSAARSRTSG
jgi:hypothetical protein